MEFSVPFFTVFVGFEDSFLLVYWYDAFTTCMVNVYSKWTYVVCKKQNWCLGVTSNHKITTPHLDLQGTSTQQTVCCNIFMLWPLQPFTTASLWPCKVLLLWHFNPFNVSRRQHVYPVMFYYFDIPTQVDGVFAHHKIPQKSGWLVTVCQFVWANPWLCLTWIHTGIYRQLSPQGCWFYSTT
jgi:hypothetical protein